MKIKKYNSKEPTASLDDRLEQYQRQAKSYSQSRVDKKGLMKNAMRGSLAALIPLAAASAVNAQCQGNQGTVNLAVGTISVLDVDNDGNTDFTFSNAGGASLFFKGSGVNKFIYTTSVITGTSIFVPKRLGSGYVITSGKNFTASNLLLCNAAGNAGSFKGGASGFIGISNGSELGFIELQVTSCTGVMSYVISEMGYEAVTNNNAVTGSCATLPVEMLYFNAKSQEKAIQLDWATAIEQNNDGFEVQRSIDGRMFLKIGWIQGNGSTNEESKYSFVDENVQPNTKYYYQLKQVDADGTEEFSPIRSAMVKDSKHVEVSEFMPNVVSKNYPGTWITINLPEVSNANITFFDGRGATVKSLQRRLDAGRNKFVLHVDDLIAGNYFVKIQMGREMVYRRLVVK